MSGLLGKIPKFTLKLPASLAKAGRTMSECPLEMSFSLCEETSGRKTKAEDILQVSLPAEVKSCSQNMDKQDALEKADEEKSEKEDNMEVTCSVSVDGQEKQEFSFTLYDFDTKERANKQDVEKIVVRSICEALGKTLKLPPSGSRTIKVKLAISPDSGSKELDASELVGGETPKWTAELPDASEPCKHQDYDSSKSANTASTYLMSSTTDKPPSGHARCPNPPSVAQPSAIKAVPSPKLRPVRHSRLVSLQRQELKCMKEHHKKAADDDIHDNRMPLSEIPKPSEEPFRCHNPQHLSSRAHVPESRERRNHYLDLAGVENDASHSGDFPQRLYTSPFVDPNYLCPYKILDRSHVCSKSHRTKEILESPYAKQPSVLCPPKETADVAHVYKTRFNVSTQDDLLNLNVDLCDLVPDAKFDWEKIHHRRSKSYDLHESAVHVAGGLYSPKLKPRQNVFPSDAVRNNAHVNSSPNHHFRFRHRDKERQRAMQQVANWIAREHVKGKEQTETQALCRKFVKHTNNGVIEKHDHHHLHEHVHHHYHHFVDLN